MSTGDTAPALSVPPPHVGPLSDGDASSPLSDVEDGDGERDDFDEQSETPKIDHASSDDELSDANDTEAETERLYDTPHSATRQKDVVLDRFAEGEVFEHTPTKLRQVITHGAGGDDDDEPLTEASMASSPPAIAKSTTIPTVDMPQPSTLDALAEAATKQEPESRKRKRSTPQVDQSDPAQPPSKRSDSTPAPDRENHVGDVVMTDQEVPSTVPTSGEHSADEGIDATALEDSKEQTAELEPEQPTRKQTRNSSRKQQSPEKADTDDQSGAATNGAAPEEDSAQAVEDEHMEVDLDEEAEAAHRNEEELARKKSAFDQLTGIEKRFATFRDRLYEERLEQLNKEEAMLRSDPPTHPEYLAMMQCIDARRDEKLRIANNELDLSTAALGRWAVARRAQIHGQYYQSVRETRERTMAELGQHWYDIQHERRKQASNVPDFGLRYPQSETQRLREAIAYNKEVSILSGVAKYEGMPAAPDLRSASMQEMDDDFEAMHRAKEPAHHRHHLPRSVYTNYQFGHGIGVAGQDFIEHTPWANPNHPSHQHLLQRQHSTQHESRKHSPQEETARPRQHVARPNSIPPKALSPVLIHGSAASASNGNSRAQKDASREPSGTHAASLLDQTSARSLKAATTAPESASRVVKHEAVAPVGGL